jgi:hypothetical protein
MGEGERIGKGESIGKRERIGKRKSMGKRKRGRKSKCQVLLELVRVYIAITSYLYKHLDERLLSYAELHKPNIINSPKAELPNGTLAVNVTALIPFPTLQLS